MCECDELLAQIVQNQTDIITILESMKIILAAVMCTTGLTVGYYLFEGVRHAWLDNLD